MARCGCGSGCTCVIQGDPATSGVSVTGNGSPTNPYLINVELAGSDVVIDFVDAITGTSKGYTPLQVATLAYTFGRLVVPGSTDTDLEVLRSGLVIDTLTIPAGLTIGLNDTPYVFSIVDYWQMRVVTAGLGASGLLVQGRFS